MNPIACTGALRTMFTDPQLLAIGTALTSVAIAAAGLCVAYVTRIAHGWLKWEK